jgi:hypothetical protein
LAPAQAGRVDGFELGAPLPDRLVGSPPQPLTASHRKPFRPVPEFQRRASPPTPRAPSSVKEHEFKSHARAQRFLAVFSAISPHFRPRRHLLSAYEYRQVMADRFTAWQQVTGTAHTS